MQHDLKNDFAPGIVDWDKQIVPYVEEKNNPALRNFIKVLKNKNAPQIVTLSNWISYLKQNTYHLNVEVLINMQ